MSTQVFDTEVLPNYTLVGFKNVDTGEVVQIRRHEPDAPARLRRFMLQPDTTFIGFNSKSFDDPVVLAFVAGRTEPEIKRMANDIIDNRLQHWQVAKKYGLPRLDYDSVDLIEVAPSFVGLKTYGARMHMPRLQEMPLAHDEDITDEQRAVIDTYNINDLDTTEELLRQLDGELMLRVQMSRQYGVDMRSKSDSQMAEQAYITSLKIPRQDNDIPLSVRYTPPAFLEFTTPALAALLKRVSEHVFKINSATGHPYNPD